jgi:hypothetical protein
MIGPVKEQRKIAVTDDQRREVGGEEVRTQIGAISESELLTSDHNHTVLTVPNEDTAKERREQVQSRRRGTRPAGDRTSHNRAIDTIVNSKRSNVVQEEDMRATTLFDEELLTINLIC